MGFISNAEAIGTDVRSWCWQGTLSDDAEKIRHANLSISTRIFHQFNGGKSMIDHISQANVEDTYKTLTGGHYFDRGTKRSFSHRHIKSVEIVGANRYIVLCSHRHRLDNSLRVYDVLVFDSTGFWDVTDKGTAKPEARRIYDLLCEQHERLPPAVLGDCVDFALRYWETDIAKLRKIFKSYKPHPTLTYNRSSRSYSVRCKFTYNPNRWGEPQTVTWSGPLSFFTQFQGA